MEFKARLDTHPPAAEATEEKFSSKNGNTHRETVIVCSLIGSYLHFSGPVPLPV
jgi:hypothetical protein